MASDQRALVHDYPYRYKDYPNQGLSVPVCSYLIEEWQATNEHWFTANSIGNCYGYSASEKSHGTSYKSAHSLAPTRKRRSITVLTGGSCGSVGLSGHCTGGHLRTVGLGSSEGAGPAVLMEYTLHSGQHHRATTRQLFWDGLPCRCEATCSASDHIMNARAYTSEHGAYVVCRTLLYTSVTGLR